MKLKRKEMAQMKRNRVEAESYVKRADRLGAALDSTNGNTMNDLLKEGIKMTNRKFSRMRSVAFKALAVGLASLMLVFVGSINTVLAGPSHSSPGQPGHNGGIQFSTPFIISITGLLINKVTDCATGVAIAPEKLTAEFVFKDGAKAPFNLQDLVKIILKAAGYQNREITSFMTMQFNLFIFVFTFIVPLEQNICLLPQPAVAQETVQVAPGCTKSLGTYTAAQDPAIDVAPDPQHATAIIVDNGNGTHTLQVTGNSLGRTTFTFSYTDAAGVRRTIEYTVEVTPICGP